MSNDNKVPEIKYLSKDNIENIAFSFHKGKSISDFPFEIEIFLKKELDYDVVPSSNLENGCNIDTALVACRKIIRIDQRIYDHQYPRACFSMAHELGHLILHKDYISYMTENLQKIERTDDYKKIINFLDDRVYNRAEWQAQFFAGAILAPKNFLKEKIIELVSERKDRNKSNKLEENDKDIIYYDLSQQFGITKSAIIVRIGTAGLEYLFYM